MNIDQTIFMHNMHVCTLQQNHLFDAIHTTSSPLPQSPTPPYHSYMHEGEFFFEKGEKNDIPKKDTHGVTQPLHFVPPNGEK